MGSPDGVPMNPGPRDPGHALSPEDTLRALESAQLRAEGVVVETGRATELGRITTLYVPFLSPVFRTALLSPMELGVAVAASSVVFWVFEADKLVRRLHVTTPAPGEEV